MYLNHQQDYWLNLLPLAKFSYSNVSHFSWEHLPFYSLYVWHPNFQVIHTKFCGMKNAKYIENIVFFQKHLHFNLQAAISQHKKFSNRHQIPAPTFKVGDQVWLEVQNICSTHPAKKFSERILGSFWI